MTPTREPSVTPRNERLDVLIDAFWTEVHDYGMEAASGGLPSTTEAYRITAIEARQELEAGIDAALRTERLRGRMEERDAWLAEGYHRSQRLPEACRCRQNGCRCHEGAFPRCTYCAGGRHVLDEVAGLTGEEPSDG